MTGTGSATKRPPCPTERNCAIVERVIERAHGQDGKRQAHRFERQFKTSSGARPPLCRVGERPRVARSRGVALAHFEGVPAHRLDGRLLWLVSAAATIPRRMIGWISLMAPISRTRGRT